MIEDIAEGSSRVPSGCGPFHFPLPGVASKGAKHAVRHAVASMKAILRIKVSSVMAVAEQEFVRRIVSAAEVRAQLAPAGRQPTKSLPGRKP